jgi:hypothetical protein
VVQDVPFDPEQIGLFRANAISQKTDFVANPLQKRAAHKLTSISDCCCIYIHTRGIFGKPARIECLTIGLQDLECRLYSKS